MSSDSGQAYDLVINNAVIVNGTGRFRGSIGVRDEKIAALSSDRLSGREEIDAGGRSVIPGVVDAHCHYRIVQGQGPTAIHSSDDYRVGPLSGAVGGVTTFVDFAIQQRGRPAQEEVEARIAEASADSVIDFSFHAALTDSRPSVVEEIDSLVDRGIASFKFFMTYSKWGFYADLGFMHAAMERIAARRAIAAIHAENDEILEWWRAHYGSDGPADVFNHARSRPEIAEEVAIQAASALALETGASLYVVHLTTARGLATIVANRARGADIVAETCPHYLAFSDDALRGARARYYTMTPPLRPDENVAELWRGLVDGRIEVVGSDHNSFTRDQKDEAEGFLGIPPGVAGSELMLPYLLSEGVATNRISLERLVQLLCSNPARIYGMNAKGSIEIGKDADLVVLDLAAERVVVDEMLHDPRAYTIFAGMRFRGWPAMTISRGEPIIVDGRSTAAPGRGRFVARSRSRSRPMADAVC
jgi:dihydropyrimidinase